MVLPILQNKQYIFARKLSDTSIIEAVGNEVNKTTGSSEVCTIVINGSFGSKKTYYQPTKISH